jgi:hypothetical protein
MGGASGVKDLVFRAYRVRARYSGRELYLSHAWHTIRDSALGVHTT